MFVKQVSVIYIVSKTMLRTGVWNFFFNKYLLINCTQPKFIFAHISTSILQVMQD